MLTPADGDVPAPVSMLNARVIPVLLLKDRGLVKTVRFKDPTYVGDPVNAVKIFNEKEVDEIAILDIDATPAGRGPDLAALGEIVSEAFMPVCYGGGITRLDQVQALFALGVEKVSLNSEAVARPALVEEIAREFGNQSVVVSLDVRRSMLGRYEVYSRGGRKGSGRGPVDLAREMESRGAGEILLNAVDRDGTMQGCDLTLLRQVTDAVSLPVIACGGVGSLAHIGAAVHEGGALAVAAGSFFVFQGRHRAVLISYPSPAALRELLGERKA